MTRSPPAGFGTVAPIVVASCHGQIARRSNRLSRSTNCCRADGGQRAISSAAMLSMPFAFLDDVRDSATSSQVQGDGLQGFLSSTRAETTQAL
eukprot:7003167-Pyramimonas_sp.AAC.2